MYSRPAAMRSSGVRSLVRELRREEADEDVEEDGEEAKGLVKIVFSSTM